MSDNQEKSADTQQAVDTLFEGLGEDIEKLRPHKRGLLARLRSYFFTGIVVATPIGVTIILIVFLVDFVDAYVMPLVPERYNPETYLRFGLPGLGLLLAVLSLTLLGALTANFAGRTLLTYGERAIDRMPVVRIVYNGIKQIFETVISQRTSFRQVGLIEWPRKGVWVIVFVAKQTEGEIPHKIGEEVISVFMPRAPNPTAGYLLFVPKRDVILLDMTLEEAAKMMISGGLVNPKFLPRQ